MRSILVASLACLCVQTMAQVPCQKESGRFICSDQKLTDLMHQGQVRLKKTEVVGYANVYGEMITVDAVFHGPVRMHGLLEMNRSMAHKKLQCRGIINARNTRFCEELEVYGNEVRLHNAQTHRIRILNPDTSPALYLTGNTIVDGDVEFNGQPGKVIKAKTAKITGRVIGGTVEKQV